MSSVSRHFTDGLHLNPKTAEVLGRFERRRRFLVISKGIASAVVSLLMVVACITLVDYLWIISDIVRWCLSVAAYAFSAISLYAVGIRPLGQKDPERIARQVEAGDSAMREDLLSAVELANPLYVNGSLSFRNRLQDIVATKASVLDVINLLPFRLISRWCFAALTLVCLFVLISFIPGVQFGRRVARAMIPGAAIQRASMTQLVVLQPSPASGFVAEGDAIAIVVEVSGRPADEIVIQWRNEEGGSGELPMTPRVLDEGASRGSTMAMQGRFAANLSVGAVPVHYRVLGGDGVTLWETLTPLPRPRVVNFNKEYQFPDYSLLSPRSEDAEHGDLKAIIGTNVNLTVRFDEPVHRAVIHFDDAGGSQELLPVDDSNLEYSIQISMRTPSTYQIDAVSLRSGLSNPYSPLYSIDPQRDNPPVVRWGPEMDRMMIVSPIDVIDLHGFASDDLPIDRVIQEFEINGQPATMIPVEVVDSDRELDMKWSWDLLHRLDSKVESAKLQNGDFVRLRFVAIDRNSQRGESALLEILVADEGFDSDRHDHLHDVFSLISEVSEWSIGFNELMEALGQSKDEKFAEQISSHFDQSQELSVSAENLLERIKKDLGQSINLPEAGIVEVLGVAVADLMQQQKRWMADSLELIDESTPAWSETRKGLINERIGLAKKYSNEALRVDQYGRNYLAELLTVAILSDMKSLRSSLEPMLVPGDISTLPIERFPRHLFVSQGRLIEAKELFTSHVDLIPENTLRHLQAWDQWVDGWLSRLESVTQNPPSEDSLRALVNQFSEELDLFIGARMIDGRIGGNLQALLRDLGNQIGSTRDLVIRLEQVGREVEVSADRAAEQDDSQDAAKFQRDQAFHVHDYQQRRDHLLQWLEQREGLHRARPNVDLAFAADTRLMVRALENVTREGYQPYQDEPAMKVYVNISKAYQTIESAHRVRNSLKEVTELLLAERRLDETASNKVQHPNWLERFSTEIEVACRQLQNSGVPADLVSRIEETRYNSDYNEARDRILPRRWNGDPMLTAEAPLLAMQISLDNANTDLEPYVVEAREVLRRYVLSLADQARQAAEEAEEAETRTESRADSEQQTANELAAEQRQVEETTKQTLESLMDLANTASLTDQEERELAMDADIASNEIQAAAEKAETLMEQATQAETEQERSELLDQTAEALGDLADSLEQTADHFEKAESGEDLTESRQQLRENASSNPESNDLDERFEQAEQAAAEAQMNAEERLRELEQELQENQPMQEELSEIARRATEAAQRTLEQVAEQEREVMKTMERSDTRFQEQKTRAAAELSSITERAKSVDEALLSATEQAIGWANTPEARPELEETRSALREAIQQAEQLGGDKAPLEEMQESAQAMSEAINRASEAVAQLNKETAAAQEENIHQDESSRRRTQSQVERFAREARTQQLRSTAEQKKQWSAAEQQANQRIQEAQRQKRDAENQMRQAQQQLDRDSNKAEQLQPQIDAAQDRVDRAEKAEQAARETKDFASQRSKETQERENQIKAQPLESFEKMNPAAELATDMTEKAANELTEIQEALGELAEQMNFADQLDTPQQTLEQVASQQNQIGERIDEAIEQLQRAARHEERLGQQASADQLSEAAEAVAQEAAAAASQALESIEQAADAQSADGQANDGQTNDGQTNDGRGSNQPATDQQAADPSQEEGLSATANQDVSEAAEAIGQAAEGLSEMLEGMQQEQGESLAQTNTQSNQTNTQSNQANTQSNQANPQSSQGQESGNPSQAEPGQMTADQQLAQTLDELDRQLAAQSNADSQAQPGEPSDSQAPSEQTAGNQSNQANSEAEGSPSENSDSQGTPSAADASPTIANNLNSQAQQAARQRQQQLNPSQNQAGQPGDPNQQQGDSSIASNESGNGQMPEGGTLDASEIERMGADWGRLRERKTDEVNEGRSATVSPIYRQQVEAYFRAIARRAADKKAIQKQD